MKVVVLTKNIVVLSHTSIKVENTIISFFIKGLAPTKANTAIDIMISATKISSKIYKLIKYDEIIVNPIYNYQ